MNLLRLTSIALSSASVEFYFLAEITNAHFEIKIGQEMLSAFSRIAVHKDIVRAIEDMVLFLAW